jgi:hypothetical protein
VVSEGRDDARVDLAAVALQRRRPDLADGDRVKPVAEPVGERRGAAGSLDHATVALLLEGPHLADDLSSLGRRDVPTVSLPLALEAHRDVAVPPPGGVLVDGALAVRRSAHRGPPFVVPSRPPHAWTLVRPDCVCAGPLRRSDEAKLWTASAGTRRQRPTCTEGSWPLCSSSYTVERPMPRCGRSRNSSGLASRNAPWGPCVEVTSWWPPWCRVTRGRVVCEGGSSGRP